MSSCLRSCGMNHQQAVQADACFIHSPSRGSTPLRVVHTTRLARSFFLTAGRYHCMRTIDRIIHWKPPYSTIVIRPTAVLSIPLSIRNQSFSESFMSSISVCSFPYHFHLVPYLSFSPLI